MSHVLLLVATLQPRSHPSAAAGSQLTWELAQRLAAAGDVVTLLHAPDSTGLDTTPLVDEARKLGVRYVDLRSTPPAYAEPLFPSSAAHEQAHHVAACVAATGPDTCIAIDALAALAIATSLQTTGAAFASSQLVGIVTQPPREWRRLREHDLPPSGRDEIVRDYLERLSLRQLRRVTAATSELGDLLVAEGYVAADKLRVLTPLEPSAGTSEPDPWRQALLGPLAEPEIAPIPRISVCMPYFDQPAYLTDALESLANQSTPPQEVIVMDDGSRTPEGAAAFAAARERYSPRGWQFVQQVNAGPAAARNRMVALARGEAVLFCDADNRFRPDMVETLARAMASTGAACVTCGFRTFSDGHPEDGELAQSYVYSPLGECLELGLLENVLGDTNFLVRRQVFLDQDGFTAERLADEDWQFLLMLLRRGAHIAAVPRVLFDYRVVRTSRARRQGEFLSAAITLAPILQESEPAWRRLWPHLVAAIRDPRVPQLEHRLRGIEHEHAAAAAKLQAELAKSRHNATRLRWELELQKGSQDQMRAQLRAFAEERARAEREAAELRHRLAEMQRHRDEAIASRDDKIQRMQRSLSWQLTSPLRAARRTLVDPLRGHSTEPTAEAASTPTLHYSIDAPLHWDSAPAAGTVHGWCLFAGQPARAMRATLDGTPLPGDFPIARPDVAAALQRGGGVIPDQDQSARVNCGFEFRYRLPVDTDHNVRVEAQARDGSWHLLREDVLRTTSRPRDNRDYSAWVQSFGTVTPERAAALRQRLDSLPADARPLISVLVPVYNAPERWLARAIESVREQVYERWELCIADDASTAPHVRPLLEQAASADPRIRITFRQSNGHISAASNSALELARGEFVALLDHDDELPPDALAEVILQLAQAPDADLVYSDEDKIDEQGRRHTPYFKPDYLPDLLLGQNCISHLSVYRTKVVRAVGGFRLGYEGSQDWDLALRVAERVSPDRVRHIPKILYHWRTVSGSTAVAVSEKNYSVDAARRALSDHLKRQGSEAEVRRVAGDHWQIVYPVPDPAPLVSVIIPTRNAAGLVRTCVASILARTEYPRFEIILVDNQSDDPAALALFADLGREAEVRVLRYDQPFNFSAINNFAARQARGEVLCFLNNDIEVITGRWLDELVSQAMRPGIGAVGAMLYYPDNTIQHAGVVLGLGGVANHAFQHHRHGSDGYMNRARLTQNYSAVTGACLTVRRQWFESVGGFNERDLPVAFNDIDLCLRLRAAGHLTVWTPFAELYHHESASRGSDETPEKRERFGREIEYMQRTWGELLARDPAYNPNLSLDLLGWALAWPPRQ